MSIGFDNSPNYRDDCPPRDAVLYAMRLLRSRVRLAATSEGEAELRARLSAMPPGDEFGTKVEVADAREYTDMSDAISEGVRLGEQRRDLSQMVELGVLDQDEAEARGYYPPAALSLARDQHLQYLAANPRF